MKTKLNPTTKTAIAILALTGVTVTILVLRFLLSHPQTPWYVITSAIPPFPGPALLTGYIAYVHHDWLPLGVSLVGGLFGFALLFLGLTRSRA